MDLKETDILGADIEQHWYYSSQAKAMRGLLEGAAPARILDIGVGSGFATLPPSSNLHDAEVWCVDISYEADSDESEAGKAVRYRAGLMLSMQSCVGECR